MDKSNRIIYFALLALVFVVYYFFAGSEDAVGDTLKSVILVGIATVLTWAVIREQKKRGRMSVQ